MPAGEVAEVVDCRPPGNCECGGDVAVRQGAPRWLQGRSVLGYLACATQTHLLGEPASSVIPVPLEAG